VRYETDLSDMYRARWCSGSSVRPVSICMTGDSLRSSHNHRQQEILSYSDTISGIRKGYQTPIS